MADLLGLLGKSSVAVREIALELLLGPIVGGLGLHVLFFFFPRQSGTGFFMAWHGMSAVLCSRGWFGLNRPAGVDGGQVSE